MKKIFLFFLLSIISFNFYGNEKEVLSDKKPAHSKTFINEKLFTPEILFYKTSKKPAVKKNIPVQKNKSKTKVTLSNKRKAAIAVNASGGGLLLAGAGLLTASLVYSDYVEKNEKDYDRYVEGKNLSRWLFYGSTAGLGAGGICLSVSIPLFIDKKSKDVKGKSKTNSKNKNNSQKTYPKEEMRCVGMKIDRKFIFIIVLLLAVSMFFSCSFFFSGYGRFRST